jgi:gas vesicle protein
MKYNEFVLFFLGIAIGVVATLLTAPYSGAETREYLRERIDEGRQSAEQAFEKGKEVVERQSGAIGSVLGYGRKPNPEAI